jgi:ABC-2 type transport system permease protein
VTPPADTTVAAARRRAAAPSPLRLGASRAALELRAFFREKDALIFAFFFPIILLGIFAVVFGGDDGAMSADGEGSSIDFVQYFLPGMVAAGIMLVSFQTLAIQIAIEREDGTLKRLRGTPMPPLSYFLGKIGMVLVTSITQTALLLAVAAVVFGVGLPTDPELWLTFVWVFVLGAAAGTVLGIAFSSVPKSGPQRVGCRHRSGADPAVHLRSLLRVQRPADLAAADRRAISAQVDGAGHAFGVPAARVRGQ